MSKIIIDNQTDLSDVDILTYIAQVMNIGLVSETHRGKQYCFQTRFHDGVHISVIRNAKSQRFMVWSFKAP